MRLIGVSGGTLSINSGKHDDVGQPPAIAPTTQTAGHGGATASVNLAALVGEHSSATVGGGTLAASFNRATFIVGGTALASGGNGALNVGTNGSMAVNGTLKVWDVSGNGLTLNGGSLSVSTLDLSGNATRFNWSSGTLSAGYAAETITVPSSGTLEVDSPATLAGGVLVNSGGAVNINAALTTSNLTDNGSISSIGSLTVSGIELVGGQRAARSTRPAECTPVARSLLRRACPSAPRPAPRATTSSAGPLLSPFTDLSLSATSGPPSPRPAHSSRTVAFRS